MQKPFVTLKLAQTLDGCIATTLGDSKWITSAASRAQGHQLRAEADAILVGAGTVRADDPELSVRLVEGKSPTKIVLDAQLDIAPDRKVFDGAPLILIAAEGVAQDRIYARESDGAQVWQVGKSHAGQLNLAQVMARMIQSGLQTLLIEGGSRVAASALQDGLVDRLVVFIAPKILGVGLPSVGALGFERIADAIQLQDIDVKPIGDDLMYTAHIKK
ncbi:MAG: bifunctional diaminohydroxyphosphoribosylaminopyrimidine deaminase/5-amino-6-(5-phosphoribosylamino)uracil reductase RibD [Candidatus Latescibacteria bacterium]|jgi:diaminohydroxyphosphoribosylaminopyrimidine deaminase / 5-amino-6-(5-phosphoribosylamino)uracil reductase|nr:bifunctional diaminohydroxyphosphoribosylaminopyrimidine deaminase/5-amino-6-(5-phosphoribosylamino)uracil reductase RibD [Candidatus Latescibacterota bacterium]MBT4140927.1 bifunctional diaminohydroxyphosphoribosylaminopyrimidine deaminase/5-amino-6-(5-phosphoribosylamino)uracil reductase RibD [Candidatus Latescibacterota bacterium]MBT5830340.1 bifunctional diaminohydroxyphosphoribosylaminopyrimidine deaminase/5-amino-6-(5-phosphoribosylamino)uracil reductase RibD [Candidatus Latescibacterota